MFKQSEDLKKNSYINNYSKNKSYKNIESNNKIIRNKLSHSSFKTSNKTNLSNNEIKIKIKNVIKEYLLHKNIDESLPYFNEIDLSKKYLIYEEILNYIYNETNNKNVDVIILFLVNIIKNNIIKFHNIISGIENTLENLEEIILDTPHAKIYITKVFNELINNKIIDKEKLISIISNKSSDHNFDIII